MPRQNPGNPSDVSYADFRKRAHCRDWLKRRMSSAVGKLQKPDWRTLDSMILPEDTPR